MSTSIRKSLAGSIGLLLVAIAVMLSTPPAQASGLTWTLQTSPASSDWKDVTFGNGTFVAVSSGPSGSAVDRVMTSTDGVTWTATSAASDTTWVSVIYGNGTFMAVATSGAVMTSPDGTTWTLTTGTGFDTRAVAFGNGAFVAIGRSGNRLASSTDNGSTWTAGTGSYSTTWYGGTFGNNMFVAVGAPTGGVADAIYSNASGTAWTPSTHIYGVSGVPLHIWNDVAFGAGQFVAVGQRAPGFRVMTSSDAATWTERATPVDNAWESIVYADGQFVAVADNGTGDRIMTSSDGVAWNLQADPGSYGWQSITYGSGTFVAVGTSGAIMTAGASGGGGSSGSGAGGSVVRVPDVLQQYPIAAELAVGSPVVACEANAPGYVVDGRVSVERQFDAWTLSYAQWPNDGAGGYVCTRTLSYEASADMWLTASSVVTGSGVLQQYAIGSSAVLRMVAEDGMSDAAARVAYCRTHAPDSAALGRDWGQRNEGWRPSYASWLNGGAGGWVCSRTL